MPRLNRVRMRRMVGHHDGRPVMWLPKFAANEGEVEPVLGCRMPRHEAADMPAIFSVSDEAVVVQLLPRLDH